jgi:hypothetical protein
MRSLSWVVLAAQVFGSVTMAATCATCHANSITKGPWTWRVERAGADVTYSVSDGKNSLTLPVRWIFGETIQTYVLEYGDRFYESRVTYFPMIDKLDFTPGDQLDRPATVADAMGRALFGHEIEHCFGCHSTGALVNDRLQPGSATLGLQCQHCHSGADLHLQDVARGQLGSAPPKLGRMATEDVSNFCGQCHRSWAEVVRSRMFSPADVRFQPYRLTKSRCFDGSDPRISCLACHDPHSNLVVDNDAYYEAKCLACHSRTAAASSGKPAPKLCPVANSGCIGCHMPKTDLPPTHRTWTDHFIRVVRAGEPFPE